MLHLILMTSLAVFFYMTAVFLIALLKKDNSVVDIAWGPGFVVVALVSFFWEPGFEARHVLITALVLAWAARLALHIYLRNKGRGEDYRYAQWRRSWGRWFVLRSFFQVFMLQGIFLILISYPLALVNLSAAEGLSPLDIAGTLVWLVGFFFEAVGDHQLKKFKQKADYNHRLMEIYAPPQLFWRSHAMVGNIPHSAFCAGRWDGGHKPADHQLSPAPGLRGRDARKEIRGQ
jgi:steroid 5-alpha reductase family enzyme